MSDNQDITALSFENAVAELETIIKQLETGKVSLEESVAIYTRGVALRKHCEFKLSEAEAKVEQIIIHKDGTAEVKPFDTVK